ncbi:MAG: FKBP-type peptidyl-prolyl cis-trans isomerase, partial [Phaeodactylibacter sp.]|nr:FKBP-type peptidyl-prolyl cis-trans isomerase [Phaeodactylibacter sp.]
MSSASDSLSYSLGVLIGKNLKSQGFTDDLSPEQFLQAIKDVIADAELKIQPQDANKFVSEFSQTAKDRAATKNLEEGQAFLAENGKRSEVTTTATGLQYEVLKEGAGESPKPTDRVSVHYHGTLLDGTVFDSSVERGEPAQFPVQGVIPGWVEALQLMKPGSKWKLYIPSDLAYGSRGAGGDIGPNSTLIFEVELLEILN